MVLKKDIYQAHENYDDLNHPGEKVGKGVYCTPRVEKAIEYAGIIDVEDKHYMVIYMVRVNPKKIKFCNCQQKEYWVVNGTIDEIRPYRILYKEV